MSRLPRGLLPGGRVWHVALWSFLALLTLATHVPSVDPDYLAYLEGLGPMQPDKSAHFISYGILGLLAMLAFGTGGRGLFATAGWLLGVLAAWAVFDEVTQPLFGRGAELFDWFCDLAGLAIGLMAGIVVVGLVQRRTDGRPPESQTDVGAG